VWLQQFRWRSIYIGFLALAGIGTIPYGVPVLSIESFLRYQEALPLSGQVRVERDSAGLLPQLYADMFGWESMAATVSRVYRSLPEKDRARCAIFAGNYGEAGAIDFYGPALGLPKAISPHNNYYFWGPGKYTGEVAIVFGERAEALRSHFETAEQVATISHPYAMAVERDLPVYVCRGPKAPLRMLWPALRFYL
jgi:hypothetical protein